MAEPQTFEEKRKSIAARFGGEQPDFSEWKEHAAAEELAEVIANAEVGEQLPDGTVYAGISPDTNERMYVTPKDAGKRYNFNEAARYAEKKSAHGHNDWRVPSYAELKVIYENSQKGALKGTFQTASFAGAELDNYYLSSEQLEGFHSSKVVCFGGGGQPHSSMLNRLRVRCVR